MSAGPTPSARVTSPMRGQVALQEHLTACGATGGFAGSRGAGGHFARRFLQPVPSLPAGSSPRSSRPPAGRWRRRRSCWIRLAGRRRSCCTVCSTLGTAPPSPWLLARCPSSPRSTGGTVRCRGTAGASLQPCEPRAALIVPPSRGRAPGWPSPRGASWTGVMEHFTGHLCRHCPARVGLQRDSASHPCSTCTPSSGEGLSGGERGQPDHADLHWAGSDPALGSEYKQHQCCVRA